MQAWNQECKTNETLEVAQAEEVVFRTIPQDGDYWAGLVQIRYLGRRKETVFLGIFTWLSI